MEPRNSLFSLFHIKLLIKKCTLSEFSALLTENNLSLSQLDQLFYLNRSSLMSVAISGRNWDVARFLYMNGIRMHDSYCKEGNELGVLAWYLREEGALNLALFFLEQGVSLDYVDKKNGNTTLLTLCICIVPLQQAPYLEFLSKCLQSASSETVFRKNKNGANAWDCIHNHYLPSSIQHLNDTTKYSF